MVRNKQSWSIGYKLLAVPFTMGMWLFFVLVYNAWATGAPGAGGLIPSPAPSAFNTFTTIFLICVSAVLEAVSVAIIVSA
jgi:hypothetical protein